MLELGVKLRFDGGELLGGERGQVDYGRVKPLVGNGYGEGRGRDRGWKMMQVAVGRMRADKESDIAQGVGGRERTCLALRRCCRIGGCCA